VLVQVQPPPEPQLQLLHLSLPVNQSSGANQYTNHKKTSNHQQIIINKSSQATNIQTIVENNSSTNPTYQPIIQSQQYMNMSTNNINTRKKRNHIINRTPSNNHPLNLSTTNYQHKIPTT